MRELQVIKPLIEKKFQHAVEDKSFSNEKHLRKDLTEFLRINLPANIKISNEVRSKFGIIDILIDDKYIIELKYADNKGTLDRGIAETKRYKELGKIVIVVILDVGVLDQKVIDQYSKYYKEEAAETIIIRVKRQRKRTNTVTSSVKNLMRGKKFITIEEISKKFQGGKEILWVILSRLEKQGWIERIEKGKYMIIPLGAEKGKYTLNEFVIGSLLVNPYCIAYWSALHFYGLTEQIPNKVFIQTTARKKKQETKVFGIKYRIVKVKDEKFFGVRKEWIEEMQINITDKEKTIIDCLDKPQYCGEVIEVAKALKNENIDRRKLIDYSQQIGNSGVIRRLGYLCDFLRVNINVPEVKTRNYLSLDPTMPHKGPKNSRWRLTINLNEKVLGKLE